MGTRSHHPLVRRSVRDLVNPQQFVARPPLPPGDPVTLLDGNENPFWGPFNRYPDSDAVSLREAYARYLNKEAAARGGGAGARLSPEVLLPTRGSLEALDLLLRVFCEPGQDAICVASPSFPMYSHWARGYGIRVVEVPLAGSDLDRLDVRGMIAAKSKLTFLTTPHNPLGNTLSLETVAELAGGASGLVIVDEAYIEFSSHPSCACLLERAPNVVVVRTLSKAWGQAGLRVGMMIAEPSILESARRLLDPYQLSVPSMEGIVAALDRSEGIALTWHRIREERESMRARLARSPHVRKVYRSEANFVLVEVHEPEAMLARLLAARVVVRPMVAPNRHALRLTVALPHENEKALQVFDHP